MNGAMELLPTVGLNNLLFGMTAKEVALQLGAPSKVFNEEDEPEHLVHQYDTLKLRLTYYGEEGGRLGYIHCAAQNLQVNGKPIIGQPVDVVKDQFQQTSPTDWEVEAYTFFDTHFSEGHWLILNVEYGVVTDVEIGVPFKNDEEYDWKR